MKRQRYNKRILVLCEGHTEYAYAKALQQRLPRRTQGSIAIDLHLGSRNDPKSLAQEAQKRKRKAKRERNAYDAIWLFFDKDTWPQLGEAFRLIAKEDFSIAYSSLCIEHWFILHFENCGRAFSSGDEALRHLKTLWPVYHKTKIKHFDFLADRLEKARERAELLNKEAERQEALIYNRNPFFTIHSFIYFFDSLKEL